MYEPNSATVLKVGIADSSATFKELFDNHIRNSITIHKSATLEVDMVDPINTSCYLYNFIFYVVQLSDILTDDSKALIIKYITHMTAIMAETRNHLFVIVDVSNAEMQFDDDGDLIFEDEDIGSSLEKFAEEVNKIKTKIITVCKITIPRAKIFLQIVAEKSIVNLETAHIDILADLYVKKALKMSTDDKKRELKIALKKMDLEEKLNETGYSEVLTAITRHFKLAHQKKIICKNYLYALEKCPIAMGTEDVANFVKIIDEIFSITYLKSEMYEGLIEKVESLLDFKLKDFYARSRNRIAIDSKLLTSIDAYAYHDFLLAHLEIESIKNDKLASVKKLITTEIDFINKIIVDHYNKEVGKMINLERIAVAFKVFAQRDKANIPALFEKIKTNPQIITENMGQMQAWISFIDMTMKLGIEKGPVVDLIELVIIEKIKYNVDMTKSNQPNVSVSQLYPHCLLTFLLKNLAVDFVFEKLYMFLASSIRYASRNLPELIQGLNIEKYNSLLELETKLLELVKRA
jgi:hypothetical protein